MARQVSLSIAHDRMPDLTLREVMHRSISFGSRDKYQLELSAHGVQVIRGLEVEDIELIRDWCNEALEAAEAMKVAAE
jgi:hypothetical protein